MSLEHLIEGFISQLLHFDSCLVKANNCFNIVDSEQEQIQISQVKTQTESSAAVGPFETNDLHHSEFPPDLIQAQLLDPEIKNGSVCFENVYLRY